MQTLQMPGAAVALVQENHIVYARGFGVRDVHSNAPASPHTRFRIASNTRSMISLLAATVVDQGVLEWDAPVFEVWPEFLAPTPALTQNLRAARPARDGSGVAESPTIEFFMSGRHGIGAGSVALDRVLAGDAVHCPPQPDMAIARVAYRARALAGW
jgi:hypothetical protein